MDERLRVLVVGDQGVTTASALQDVSDRLAVTAVRTLDSDASEVDVGDIDCVVYDGDLAGDFADVVATVRGRNEGMPVVAFASDADPDSVGRVLGDSVDGYVRKVGDERYVLLAHRIERVVRDAADGAFSERAGEGDRQSRPGTASERAQNERALRELQGLAASTDHGLETKLARALAVGRTRLDLPRGYLTRIEDGTQTVVVARDDREELQDGATAPLPETYCQETVASEGLVCFDSTSESGRTDDRDGPGCYLGGQVLVNGERYGTVWFASTDDQVRSFTDAEKTFVELLVEWVSNELERHERQHDLERHEAIVESIDDGVYELDPEGTIQYVNPALCELTGYTPSELVGEHYSKVVDERTTARAEQAVTDALGQGHDGETFEVTVQPKGDRPVECEVNMTVLRDAAGEYRGTVGVVRDVTEQRAYRDRLSELLSASRTLMQARSREEVAEMVVTAAKNVLGFELNVVRLYDADAQELVPVASTSETEEALGEQPRYGLNDGPPGEVFATGESLIYDDVGEIGDDRDRSPLQGAMYFPMGVHGTVSLGTTSSERMSHIDQQLAALLSTSAAAACNRAKREEEIREAHERIDALVDHINGLIEDTIEVLVNATTRDEIESKVCTQLVDAAAYDCAWIARPDLSSETLELSHQEGCAGLGEVKLGIAPDATDPCVRAFREGEPQIVEDLGTLPAESVHATAVDEGMTGLLALPLSYKETTYGVLTVYAASTEAFEDRERVVLAALARAIGNAINAVERGRILTTDRVVELEVTVRDDDLLFGRLSGAADCTLESTGTLQQSDGTLELYLTSEDADPERVLEVARGDPSVEEAVCIVDHEGEVLFEVTATETLVTTLAERGAMPLGVAGEDGTTRITVEVPYESEAREVFDLVADRYDNVDLVGYHEHERPVRTRQEFRAAVTERFTQRQATAIRSAYLGGFFEWPRDVDGTELAESMDVTRPTYHQHLRAAQRKVLEELFEPER